MLVLKIIIFYGSFLVFPFLGFLIWLFRKKYNYYLLAALFFLSLIFIYARFIETNLLLIKNEHLDLGGENHLRIALFADQHIGLYTPKSMMKRIVDEINQLDVDLVFIAGDLIYEPSRKEFPTLFESLAEIKVPVYAVTGNHDSQHPGTFKSVEVREAVEKYGVKAIDNKLIEIEMNREKIKIIGLSDIWERQTEFSLLNQVKAEDKVIVLVHNPDAAYEFPNSNADLILAGHTHGGQIRLPWIYKYVIPTEHDFDSGWYEVGGMKVYVTSGVGTVGLPMRFLVPPEIVVIDVKI